MFPVFKQLNHNIFFLYTFFISGTEHPREDNGLRSQGNTHKHLTYNRHHYRKFNDVYGLELTDEHIPSFLNNILRVAEEQQGCKSTTLAAQNVCSTVACRKCKKLRCIYATRKLSSRELKE